MNVFAVDYDKKIMRTKKNQKNKKPLANTSSAVEIHTVVVNRRMASLTQTKGTSLITLRHSEGMNKFILLFSQL